MTNSKSNQEIVQGLHREVKALRAENKALRRLVKELEEKLNTNSRNSSKAPSQDPYRRRKGKKKPSEKGQGAQEGHKGHARSAVPPENVNEFRDIYPLECPRYGGSKFNHVSGRQVTELPEILPHVIQFNIHTNQCSCCGHVVKADTPKEAMSAFGPRLKGFISLLV